MTNKQIFTGVLLASLLVMAAGQSCGFRLRGSVNSLAGLEPTYVMLTEGDNSFLMELRRTLTKAEVPLVDSRGKAKLVLTVLRNERGRRVLSYDANGRPREYELYQNVDFNLVDNAGLEVVPKHSISLIRDFEFDEADVLGKSDEQAMLQRDMQREITRRIVQRLHIRRNSAS